MIILLRRCCSNMSRSISSPFTRNALIRSWNQQHQHLGRCHLVSITRTMTSPSIVQTILGSPSIPLYQNPWETTPTPAASTTTITPPHPNSSTTWRTPLKDLPHLDLQSRHVIQLLQELYVYRRPVSQNEVVTTNRCNTILKQLFPQKEHPNSTSVPITNDTVRSDRAHCILQLMQQLEQVSFMTTTTTTRTRRPTYALPIPNRETYRLVLHLDSRTKGPSRIPERTFEVVWYMQKVLYEQRGLIEYKPHGFHWMCVFHAWKECTDQDILMKAQTTLYLLLQLQKDQQIELQNDTIYFIVLRLCATSLQQQQQQARKDQDDDDDNTKILLLEGVIELWNSLQHQPLLSHYYSAFLQVFRYYPTQQRIQLFENCWIKACQYGKVNAIILNEFLIHSKWQSLIHKYLGNYPIAHLSPNEAIPLLMRSIPFSWTCHAD